MIDKDTRAKRLESYNKFNVGKAGIKKSQLNKAL